MKKKESAIAALRTVTAKLRSPKGCPWDREQDHKSIRMHAIEEVYELLDAIEAGDDQEMLEELGDVLFQVVFHSQLARERGAFDFDEVARHVTEKLVRRHPHVFGDVKVKNVGEVWANWEKIKLAEKHGTRHARPSALDGVPRRLPALMRAEKLIRKARKAGLLARQAGKGRRGGKSAIAGKLFNLTLEAEAQEWSAEELLRKETARHERAWRRSEGKK